MADNEEFSRFLKSLNKCRVCEHVRIVHSTLDKICLDVQLFKNGKAKMCSCKEYVPKENLEYLEYKYGKKKGKNDNV